MKEGWTWVLGSPKWHYFREKRSLCRKWMILFNDGSNLEQGSEDSPDNCKACLKKLLAEREKAQGKVAATEPVGGQRKLKAPV